MEKIYKKEIQRLMPLFQAIAEGKTIQWYDMGLWRDIDGDEEGFFLDTFVGKTVGYRIKPEPKYRPFKDAEECWKELLKHQPFGWVKDRNGSKFTIGAVDSDNTIFVCEDGTRTFDEVFKYYTFVDGIPFGILVEE